MAQLHISDLESAVNFWRNRAGSGSSLEFGPELNALTEVYAQMVFDKTQWVDEQAISDFAYLAWLSWYDTTQDTPCIAICSTSQGDSVCKGCGRQFEEVQRWPEMAPLQKRSVWIRITQEASALRFNRYAERTHHRSKVM